ncbi:hypothetical protein FZC66_06460 [Priestia megaterium]|nr:hypothetical protein FZC66_06460 [Priestia megaterium]
MSFVLLLGLIVIAVLIIFNNKLFGRVKYNNKIVQTLHTQQWFQNHWLSGLFLFGINVFLFGATALLLYLLTLIEIPFIHILIMMGAVVVSILVWVSISESWNGTRRNRLKMGFLGSSFYLFLSLLCMYRWITLKPSYPGEGPFMAALGFLFGFVVSSVAFITCFAFTAFSRKTENHNRIV